MLCTRPKTPASMQRRISRNQGAKRKFSWITSGTPAASASAVIASACSRLAPKGFWQMVGMPRSMAARTAASCATGGSTTSTSVGRSASSMVAMSL
jgi:hypothetical protein